MYELVEKYLRRLDTELHKFKCELEADNKGITELLEKRSLELDSITAAQQIPSHQQKENRYERLVKFVSFFLLFLFPFYKKFILLMSVPFHHFRLIIFFYLSKISI